MGAIGFGGAQNRVGNANSCQARQIKCYNCNGICHIARNYTQPKRSQNSEYFKENMLLMQGQENRVELDEEQLLFIAGGQNNAVDEYVDEQPIQDLALNVDNVFQVDNCDAFDSNVDEAPTEQTMFMENLSSTDLVYDEAGPSYDSDILSDVHDHDQYQDTVCKHHEVQPALYNGHELIKTNYVSAIVHNFEETLEIAEITRKKMNDKMKEPEYFHMHEALNGAQNRIAKLESENSNLQNKIQKDDHDVMLKDQVQSRGNMIRELREKVSRLTKKHSNTDPIHDLKALDSQNKELHVKVNALHDLSERWRAENEKVKRHYKELYDSIKLTRAKTIDKTNSLITEVANLKAQITENHKSNCVTMPAVKPKMHAPGMCVIDVEPIPPRNKNNREVQLDYLKHLNESVATLREIVEEARAEKPFDSLLASACRYILSGIGRICNWTPTEIGDPMYQLSIFVRFQMQVVHIVLWYLDSGCSKHMTEDRSRLRNFVKKFIETVRFRNDHFGAIVGYGDYVIGDSVISRDGVVERRNRTLVEAARTMLIFFMALMFLWAESVATACYTQNRSLIHTRHNKTPYQLVHAKKPDLTFFRIFETIHVQFDELTEPMAPVRLSTRPAPKFMTSGLEYLKPPRVERPVSPAPEVPVPVNSAGTPSSTTIDQDAPSPSHSSSSLTLQSPSLLQGVAAESTIMKDNPFAPVDNDPFVNVFALEPHSKASSLGDESFSPVARIEAIKIIIANATRKNMIIYQMDVKTAFHEWRIKGRSIRLKVSQNPRGIFINQSKFALEILKKFTMDSCDPVDTPMVDRIKLDKDPLGIPVDQNRFRSMDTRRSTSGSAQFHGDKLASWSSKKQKSTTITKTEAEYISMSGCCAQILWMREQVKNGVVELYFMTTDYQLADIFTNALPRERFKFLLPRLDKMADENVLAPAPTRSDDQILPFAAWDMRNEALEPADLDDRDAVVVDVGGGTGFTTFGIVKNVDAKNVTILDQSPHQLAKAKEKEGLKECMIIEGDAEDLPFEKDDADRYVSAGSIEYWPDPQRGIKEAYRVLKKGGKACLIGPVYPTFWLSCFFADVWMLFPKEEEYIDWFEKAGFKDVHIKRIGPKWYRGVAAMV
nr:2-methyl-6-phytyl-1,4-hydroquinone methyltransferase, chloroplastic [Tanacetum cinerariifolium]